MGSAVVGTGRVGASVVSTGSTTRGGGLDRLDHPWTVVSTSSTTRGGGLDRLDHPATLDHPGAVVSTDSTTRNARPPGAALIAGGLEPVEEATGALLGGQGEQPVVPPAAVDVEITGGVADLREAEFLHHPEAGGVLGPDCHLDTVQAQLEQAVVDGQGHSGRDHVLAGVALVHPVADLCPAGRPTHDVRHRDLPREHAFDGDRERQCAMLPSLPPEVADERPEAPRSGVVTGWDRRLPRPQPFCVASAYLVPGPGVAHGQGAQTHATGRQVDLPGAQWSLPVICSTACTSIGARTASPSLTPPREPGRFTINARPYTPASPRDSAAVGTPAAEPYARIASAMPGTSRSRRARVTSGVRSVGVRPVPPVVSTARAPACTASRIAAPTGSPSGTTTGPVTSNPSSVSASTINGPVVSS